MKRHTTSGIEGSNSHTTFTISAIRSVRLLLRHANVVDHNTEEERQTDRGDHPRTTQVLIHMSFAEANQRHKTQSNTCSGGDCKPDDSACAALVLRQREPTERGSNNQSETTLERVRDRTKDPSVLENLQQ
jgi:hypothetical protein